MKRLTLLFVMSLILFSGSFSQSADNKFSIHASIGPMEYYGDMLVNNFSYLNHGFGLGGGMSYYLNPSFDLSLDFLYDGVFMLKLMQSEHLSPPPDMDFAAHMYDLNLNLKYKLNNGYLLPEDFFASPFLKFGVGGVYAKSTDRLRPILNLRGDKITENEQKFVNRGENGLFSVDKIYPNIFTGVGIDFKILKPVSLVTQVGVMYPFTDEIDGITGDVANVTQPLAKNLNDMFVETTVSLVITPGAFFSKDSDGDGVKDGKDECPDTPPGVEVDENGCPVDGDGDGVPDYLDECPDVAGPEMFNGCPDTDGDGIPDKNDECPEVAGLKILNGCPDSDGDGIPDKDDRCPDTPKGYKVDKFGCPLDSDRDGIYDSEDDCPDEPGVAELKGCPYDAPTLMAKYGLANKVILFDFDKSELRVTGKTTLNQIYDALSNHEGFGVLFEGHTDYIGTERYNVGLSERRAMSAKNFLIQKGIEEFRIKTQWYGEEEPADTNKTTEGRQNNRRVEFQLYKIK